MSCSFIEILCCYFTGSLANSLPPSLSLSLSLSLSILSFHNKNLCPPRRTMWEAPQQILALFCKKWNIFCILLTLFVTDSLVFPRPRLITKISFPVCDLSFYTQVMTDQTRTDWCDVLCCDPVWSNVILRDKIKDGGDWWRCRNLQRETPGLVSGVSM